MARKFYILDVFSDKVLAGNPLAVVMDSDGLDGERMQAIAAELNLSETVFVSPPTDHNNGASIRIFTPSQELPFAGHPTVGTALLLNQLNLLDVGDDFTLEERVGPVRCVISDQKGSKLARFDLPRISTVIDHPFDGEGWAKALGLQLADLDIERCSIWDGGLPYTMIPVNSIDAVRQIEIDLGALSQVEPIFDGIAANPYVFCHGGVSPGTDFHARMFAPLWGIPEDPATGSAVAAMSGWIAKNVMSDDETRSFVIEQGFEMGRPSRIHLDISKQMGKTVSSGIAGQAVIVGEGVLYL